MAKTKFETVGAFLREFKKEKPTTPVFVRDDNDPAFARQVIGLSVEKSNGETVFVLEVGEWLLELN